MWRLAIIALVHVPTSTFKTYDAHHLFIVQHLMLEELKSTSLRSLLLNSSHSTELRRENTMDDPRYELVGAKSDDCSSFGSRVADARRGPWYKRRVFQIGMAAVGVVVLGLIIWAIVRDSAKSSTTPAPGGQALPSSGADQIRTTVPPTNKHSYPDTRYPFLDLYGVVDDSVDPDLYDYCSVPPLTYVETISNGVHVLNVNRSLSRFYFESQHYVCCFATITTDDVAIAFMRYTFTTKGFSNKCSFFKESFTLKWKEAVLVVCSSAPGGKVELRTAEYKYIHHLSWIFSDKSDTDFAGRLNLTLRNKSKSGSDELLNVFVLGFESEAASNMMTRMPNTLQFFQAHNFIQLERFAKISMNASMNRIAVTAGVHSLSRQLICRYGTNFSEHYCPLFNSVFRDQGYKREDTTQSMAYYEAFFENGTDTCRGPTFSTRLFFDSVFNSIEKNKNYYLGSIKWMWRISEKDLKYAQQIDSITRESLVALQRNGVLNSSVVIFLSFNNDSAFASPIKPIAERNDTFVFISFPQWFKEKYPQDMKNLESNAKKMTTPYDLYFTVIDIMKKTTPEGEKKEDFSTCEKCGSLLNPLMSRTCKEAAVPLRFCLV